MNLTEVTLLMTWIHDHSVAEYVKIDTLQDKILDLLVTEIDPEDLPTPVPN